MKTAYLVNITECLTVVDQLLPTTYPSFARKKGENKIGL